MFHCTSYIVNRITKEQGKGIIKKIDRIQRQGKIEITHTKTGTYKVRNEIETKRNETKSTKSKRNEINKNETKRNEINEMKTKPTKSTKTKRNTMLDYFPHMSQCIYPGEDRI